VQPCQKGITRIKDFTWAVLLILNTHFTDQKNVRPCTNSKHKMWWCSIKYDLQFFLVVDTELSLVFFSVAVYYIVWN